MQPLTHNRQEETWQVPPAPPPPREPAGPPPVVLRRTSDATGNVIAGVAAGIGRYLGVDAVVVRAAFVLLTLLGGSGVLLYLLCWLVIPEESPADVVGPATSRASGPVARGLLGLLLILFGVVTLLSRTLPDLGTYLGPALLIGLGVVVLTLENRR
jgi:phage shock protein PspC (stress-responsive transcriptional regulator)